MDSVLAENCLFIMYFVEESVEEHDSSLETVSKCVKLKLKSNIDAYINRKNVVRSINPVVCDSNVTENVISNYIIVKQILSNLPWQEKLICKLVCGTWYSAIQTLQKEQVSPEDFVVHLVSSIGNRHGGMGWFKQSGIFYTEPLVVFAFANTVGFNAAVKCNVIKPCPCGNSCKMKHSLLDLINNHVGAPKNCMVTVRANYLVYRPRAASITYEHSIIQFKNIWTTPYVAGLFIPKIPDVGFQVINIKSQNCLQEEFYDVVHKLSEDHIIKGVLVYVTEKYLLDSVENIVFLNFFKEIQLDVPYAFGGCIVEDTMTKPSEMNHLIDSINVGADFISENLLTICLFTVPKNNGTNENNFDMFSFIIESSEWTKPKIQEAVTEFSKRVPRFEHSIALKLSCVGRDQKHVLEQDCFRAAFPSTPIVGCYGNGELGINHPAKTQTVSPSISAKRPRHNDGPQFGIMYSYSTVFVYFGWGKITSPMGPL